MGSFLYDGSAINDKNLIRIFNRRQSMGNRYDRFPMCQRGNSLLNQMLVFRVNAGRGLVQNHNRRVFQHGSGNRNSLLFTAGKRRAALTDYGIISIWQGHDKIVAAGFFRGGDYLFLRSIRATEFNIVADRIPEQIYILEYQKKILQKYALEHGYTNFRFYIDDGISGTTFNRPGFQEMIADVEAGIVKRVIIKDMSRFGRDYLQVGMYTEIMFPEHDVHFIAVNDGVDSTQGDNEFTPFRNIINEWYAKDTSKKIRAVMKVKGNAGEHLTTNAPYGYMKDPDDSKHWIPDREAADVVYEIGLYVMDGFGPSQIARKLRERKILTPAAYYESKGIPCNVKRQGDPYGWDNTTIAGIMDRWREYLGHTVNFKTTKKSYKSKKKIKNPESEWVIFENTHEPIWTEAIAEAVKQARQSRRRPTKMGEMGMFSGMMYCADCGSILYQCRATGFRKDQEYYICSGYRKGKQVCGTPHSIRTVILEELILQNLREIVSFARSHENRFVQMVMDMDVKERNKGLAKKRKLLSEGEERITELDMIFKRLYEDNISGKLTDERFHKLSTDYEAEQAGLQTQAAILREEIEEVEGKSANVDRFLSVVRQYTDIPELTPRILHEFVEKIVIHAATDPHSKINRRQEVDIYYKGIGILEMSKVFDSRQK